LGYTFVADNIGLTSTTLTTSTQKATKFGEIMPNKSHYAVQGHSLSLILNGKPICNLLLVINTDLHSISQHFRIIADYWSNFRFRQRRVHTRSG